MTYVNVPMSTFLDQIKIFLDRQEKLHDRQSELKSLLENCESSGNHASSGPVVSSENWSGPFEWDSEADDVRFNVFGISTYRPNQREVSAISIILYCFALLPLKAIDSSNRLIYLPHISK